MFVYMLWEENKKFPTPSPSQRGFFFRNHDHFSPFLYFFVRKSGCSKYEFIVAWESISTILDFLMKKWLYKHAFKETRTLMKKESSIFRCPIIRPSSLNPTCGLQSLLPQALHHVAYMKGLDWHKEGSIPKKGGEGFRGKGCFKKGHFF